jgi:hypothetical protein
MRRSQLTLVSVLFCAAVFFALSCSSVKTRSAYWFDHHGVITFFDPPEISHNFTGNIKFWLIHCNKLALEDPVLVYEIYLKNGQFAAITTYDLDTGSKTRCEYDKGILVRSNERSIDCPEKPAFQLHLLKPRLNLTYGTLSETAKRIRKQCQETNTTVVFDAGHYGCY